MAKSTFFYCLQHQDDPKNGLAIVDIINPMFDDHHKNYIYKMYQFERLDKASIRKSCIN